MPGVNQSLEKEVQGVRFSAINTPANLPSRSSASHAKRARPFGTLEVALPSPLPPALRSAVVPDESIGWYVNHRDLPTLLDGLLAHDAPIARLSVGTEGADADINAYLAYLRQPSQVTHPGGSVYMPTANLSHWQHGPLDFNPLKRLTDDTSDLPALSTITVLGEQFEGWGASAVDQLALALSWWVACCDPLTDLGLPIATVFARTELTLPTGSDFFPDLAKFRALRSLVELVAQAYGVADQVSRPRIRAVSGVHNKTFYDSDGNLLRNTTEALASLVGGVDTLALRPHDFLSPSAGAFGIRMVTNAYQVLRHEAHLGKVHDPAAGSYFIEDITRQLVERGWQQFLNWEDQGGFSKLLIDGTLEAHCRANLTEQTQAYRTHRRIAVGATRYGSALEQNTELLATSVDRGALPFERIRNTLDRQVAQGRPRPAVGVAVQPDAPVANQRKNYVQDVLTCLGLGSIVAPIAELSTLATDPSVLALVFCGTDSFYQSTVLALLQSSPNVTYPRWIAGGSTYTITQVRKAGGNGVLGIGHDLIAPFEPLINSWLHET